MLVEAASQSLACVSTAISGIPEMFTDGQNGYIVEPEDPTALAKALEAAIRNPIRRQEIGAAAEAKVRAEFDHRQSINQLAALLSA